jgi:hypothetical protein
VIEAAEEVEVADLVTAVAGEVDEVDLAVIEVVEVVAEEDSVIVVVAVDQEEALAIAVVEGEVEEVVAEHQGEEVHPEVAVEVVLEEAAMSWSSPIDMLVSLSQKERNISSSPRTWYLVKPYTAKRESASRLHLRKMMLLAKRLNTECGILSDQSWQPVY